MASLIQRMLTALYPKTELRGLMVGLDASGRTTALYKLKLGEIVTTIPTIGFNVETVTYEGVDITLWDVGGCDKIRPLWRHYFQNTHVLFFFVDSNDRQRMPEAGDELQRMAAEPEMIGVPIVILANKQDLPGARSAAEVADAMRMHEVTTAPLTCVPCVATTGDGLYKALHWALEAHKARAPKSEVAVAAPVANPLSAKEQELESLLLSWLAQEDEPDDEFLAKLRDWTLDTWDHRTHLRIAWLFLGREGRRKGMQLIFETIRNFIENSRRTQRSRGSTFHETMTYFWSHMVHYAMTTTNNPDGTFKTFLLLNPQLVNGGMFLHFYSKKLMLNSAEARTSVVLPDIRPLPSLISDVEKLKSRAAAATRGAPQQQPMPPGSLTDDDDTFLQKFEAGGLDRWSHACLLRVIYGYVARHGRKRGAELVLKELRRIEKDGFHFTIAWFWIQIVDMAIAEERSAPVPASSQVAPAPPAVKRPLSDEIPTRGPEAEASLAAPSDAAASSSTPSADVEDRGSASSAAEELRVPGTASSEGPRCDATPFASFEASGGPGGRRMREALSDAKLFLQFYSPDLIFSEKAAVEFVLPDKKPLPSLVSLSTRGGGRPASGILGSLFQKLNV